jgi:exoribonuclease-2
LYDDEATWITATATRLEQVPIAANLRHDVLDSTFTEAFLKRPAGTPPADVAGARTACTGWHATKAGREVVRGNLKTNLTITGWTTVHRAARP